MPYKEIWVPAEVLLLHKGIEVRFTYKDDDIERPNTFYFKAMLQEDWDNEVGEDLGHFDIRQLPNYNREIPTADIIREAIDNGSLPTSKE